MLCLNFIAALLAIGLICSIAQYAFEHWVLTVLVIAGFVSIKPIRVSIARARKLSEEKALPFVERFVKRKLTRLVDSDPAVVANGHVVMTDSDLKHLVGELAHHRIRLSKSSVARLHDESISVHIQAAQLGVAQRPEVARFISLYLDPHAEWPDEVEIPEEDVIALGQMLRDQDWEITEVGLGRVVQIGLKSIHVEQFRKAFKRRNKWLPSRPSPEDLARAYVATFVNNFSYLAYLEHLAAQSGTDVDAAVLECLVEQEISKQARERRVRIIAEAMAANRSRERVRISDVDGMDGIEFEQFVAKLFSAMGYNTEVTQQSRDQGADVIARRLDDRVAIQAKCYSGVVSNSAVQQVVGAKRYYGCNRAMVVTNSEFSASAVELARVNGVELVDRESLRALISKWM